MYRIQREDKISPRGERNVTLGIATTEGQALMKSFNFNSKSVLGTVLLKPHAVDTATGIITIADFTPVIDVKAVPAATHVSLVGAVAAIDFDTGATEIHYTNVESLEIDNSSSQVELTPTAVPTLTGTKFFLLGVLYFQEVNGTMYTLNNGLFNALSVIEMD